MTSSILLPVNSCYSLHAAELASAISIKVATIKFQKKINDMELVNTMASIFLFIFGLKMGRMSLYLDNYYLDLIYFESIG
jgi:hypothetical protein